MLRKAALLLMTAGIAAGFATENLLVLKVGPSWPRQLQWSKLPTAGNASVLGGWIIDRKLSFGGGVDFLWNVNREVNRIPGKSNVYRIEQSQKSFMFPVSGFLAIDPVPALRVHPCASVQVGLNNLYYSNSADSAADDIYRESGFYMGFFCKIAADAIYDLGEKSGLFAGLEYEWANTDRLGVKSSDIQIPRDMSGFGLRAGFRVMY